VTVRGYEQVEKTAVKVGNGAGVLVPRRWLGRRVHCILLDEGEVEQDVITPNNLFCTPPYRRFNGLSWAAGVFYR